jgi:hypothetical protein
MGVFGSVNISEYPFQFFSEVLGGESEVDIGGFRVGVSEEFLQLFVIASSLGPMYGE